MWLGSGGRVEGGDMERVGAGGSRRTTTEESGVWALQKTEKSLTCKSKGKPVLGFK